MEARTPTSEPPISAELWQRLKGLDRRCHISMRRDDQWLVPGTRGAMVWSGIGGPPAQHRRIWRVRVYPRDSAANHDILDADGVQIADALLAAVAEAERRGW